MDDDAGGMTSWYVWASLGLYPLVPGDPHYVVLCPSFNRMRLRTAGGWVLIRRETNAYAKASWRNRAGVSRALGPMLAHADLAKGGVLNVGCAGGF